MKYQELQSSFLPSQTSSASAIVYKHGTDFSALSSLSCDFDSKKYHPL
jgi:hypothetical protein